MKLLEKIKRKLTKLRLKPIHVYCFHHVCSEYDSESMCKGDWMELDSFKDKILKMRSEGVEYISLSEAYIHIIKDVFRKRSYAVVTFDDGYASLREVLPWLEQQEIPYTLFVNGKYLDGVSYRNNPNEKYLTKDELFGMNSRFLEVGHHGWEHIDATKMSVDDFTESIKKNIDFISPHKRYVPFLAYPWGKHNSMSDTILSENCLIPVLIDGMKNFNDVTYIHRELLD